MQQNNTLMQRKVSESKFLIALSGAVFVFAFAQVEGVSIDNGPLLYIATLSAVMLSGASVACSFLNYWHQFEAEVKTRIAMLNDGMKEVLNIETKSASSAIVKGAAVSERISRGFKYYALVSLLSSGLTLAALVVIKL